MKHLSRLAVAVVLGLLVAACSGEEAQITTTTLDAASLTTTTTSAGGPGGTSPDATDSQDVTTTTSPQIESWEIITRTSRSEERRVGKECRYRAAPHHRKKKNVKEKE